MAAGASKRVLEAYVSPALDGLGGGTSDTAGSITLVAGVATVATDAVRSTSLIFLTHQGTAVGNLGHLYYSITDRLSFQIQSSNASDTDTVNWWILSCPQEGDDMLLMATSDGNYVVLGVVGA
jgi:hypothetical protein